MLLNTLNLHGGGVILTAVDKSEFLKEWSGVALLSSAMEVSGEKDFLKNKRQEKLAVWRKIGGYAILVVILILFVYINFSRVVEIDAVSYSLILLLTLGGTCITALLLLFEIDKTNPQLQKFCMGGAKVNCNAILSSKAAKLFSWLSWSEVGFYYFTGSFLYILIAPLDALTILPFLNLLSLPFVFFSLYYQKAVAKQWCSLCLAVQAVLVLEFLVFILNGIAFQLVSVEGIGYFIIAFLLPITGWALVKPLLLNNVGSKRTKRELTRLKYDPVLFESLLSKQKQITSNPEGLGIRLGNPNSTHTIIKVCNPYCGPCAKAHPQIEKIIEENKEVSLQIIFTATNEEGDSRAQPVKHLMAVAESNDSNLIKGALDDWYLPEKKDYQIFSAKYPMNGELEKQGNKLEAMDKWCKETGIEFTPTFFVDGYQLPEVYDITDLNYFLKE